VRRAPDVQDPHPFVVTVHGVPDLADQHAGRDGEGTVRVATDDVPRRPDSAQNAREHRTTHADPSVVRDLAHALCRTGEHVPLGPLAVRLAVHRHGSSLLSRFCRARWTAPRTEPTVVAWTRAMSA